MNESLKKKIESDFKTSVEILEKNRWTTTVKKDQVLDVLRFLRNKGFDHLALISCVDWIKEGEFELIYILSSYLAGKERLHLILKTRISRKKSEFETIIPIFENAEPYEREIHELFGINFNGHPRLEPLFLYQDYEIPPFRKDFDTRKYVKETFESIKPVEEEK